MKQTGSDKSNLQPLEITTLFEVLWKEVGPNAVLLWFCEAQLFCWLDDLDGRLVNRTAALMSSP